MKEEEFSIKKVKNEIDSDEKAEMSMELIKHILDMVSDTVENISSMLKTYPELLVPLDIIIDVAVFDDSAINMCHTSVRNVARLAADLAKMVNGQSPHND